MAGALGLSAEPLEIAIDRGACRGAGECALRAPGSFALDADGRARLVEPRRDVDRVAVAAARACPHFAIAVRRGGSRIV